MDMNLTGVICRPQAHKKTRFCASTYVQHLPKKATYPINEHGPYVQLHPLALLNISYLDDYIHSMTPQQHY
jgi:hypothetical protein